MKIKNPSVYQDLQNGIPLKLDLGCGTSPKRGYYSVDLVDLEGVDIVADLNTPLLQLPDNSVGAVYTRHTLEHVEKLLELMSEIHRIAQPKAKIQIIVPHFSNVFGYSDPTHLRLFGLYSMFYFVPRHKQPQKRKVPSHYLQAHFSVENIQIRFYRHTAYDRLAGKLLFRLINRSFAWQEFYERRLSPFFHAWEIEYLMVADK